MYSLTHISDDGFVDAETCWRYGSIYNKMYKH